MEGGFTVSGKEKQLLDLDIIILFIDSFSYIYFKGCKPYRTT